MTIKGDPFWIQPAPITRDLLVYPPPTVESVNTQLNTSANFDVSDNFILVRMRTPRLFVDPPNGPEGLNTQAPYTDVDTINGVYQVTEVNHHFVNGLFTQEMIAIVDPVINIATFIKDIEQYEATNAQTLLAQQGATVPASNSIIPTTAIQTTPILNSNLPVVVPGYSTIPAVSNPNNPNSPTSALQIPGINNSMVGQIGQVKNISSPNAANSPTILA